MEFLRSFVGVPPPPVIGIGLGVDQTYFYLLLFIMNGWQQFFVGVYSMPAKGKSSMLVQLNISVLS